MRRLEDVRCDLNLFTINRNPEACISGYFNEDFPKIVSHLSRNYLSDDETYLEETRILDLKSHSVTRPRGFIGLEIPGLRIIIPKCIPIFIDEFVHNDSQIIKIEYKKIMSKCSHRGYDDARSRAASSLGFRFVRYPETFSIVDSVHSVSGHFARVTHASIAGNVSVFSYADKILLNFINTKRAVAARDLPDAFKDIFDLSGLFKGSTIESKMKEFWHSREEWIAGYLAGCELASIAPSDKFVTSLTNLCNLDRSGKEVYDWSKLVNIEYLERTYLRNARRRGKAALMDHSTYSTLIADLLEELGDVSVAFHDRGNSFVCKTSSRNEITVKMIKLFRFDEYVRHVHVKRSIVSLISNGDEDLHGLDRLCWAEGIIRFLELNQENSSVREPISMTHQSWLESSGELVEQSSDWSADQLKSYLFETVAKYWMASGEVFWRPHVNKPIIWAECMTGETTKRLAVLYDRLWDKDDVFYLYDAERIYRLYELGIDHAP